jgi:membrane protease YdiL (CAAX protease family)
MTPAAVDAWTGRARVHEAPSDGGRFLPIAIAALAVALLLGRSLVPGSTTRPPALLTLIYAAVLVGSIAVPLPRVGRPGRAWPATIVGTAAVAASVLVTGPPVPMRLAALALPLNAFAAVSEEALFRRLLYGRLERFGAPIAIAATAVAFAAIHLPLYGVVALPLDLGAGVLFSWQRFASGSWTAPATTHVAANVLASLR